MDVMIDLETLGTRPDAAIIQIGAVLFEAKNGGRLLNGKGFNKHVRYMDGLGTIDHDTLVFWLTEHSAAKMGEELKSAEHIVSVLDAFTAWPQEAAGIGWDAVQRVWAKPDTFDLPILRNAFVRIGRDVPWDRRATRDGYTLFDLAGGQPTVDWTGLTAHDALDDAIGQAMQVQKAMAAFSVH